MHTQTNKGAFVVISLQIAQFIPTESYKFWCVTAEY